ncbi:hypothetical protein SAMN05216352_101537 [Alteribacillus bidgolensis]|uniref:Uncharacterized protein n=1 Tax=Alteribacillus bidgolensis TaxID=930129 RepID=A0A1G8D443_9BACI|nr:hypothetical protein SAMN05216352_101537 [Alteribacillus bidgolensis]
MNEVMLTDRAKEFIHNQSDYKHPKIILTSTLTGG